MPVSGSSLTTTPMLMNAWNAIQRGDAHGEQPSERVGRGMRDPHAHATRRTGTGRRPSAAPDEPQLLADHREHVVVVGVGQYQAARPTGLTQAVAEDAAQRQRVQPLDGVEAVAAVGPSTGSRNVSQRSSW